MYRIVVSLKMRKIKIALIFFLLIIITGCLNDDDNTPFFFEAVAIEEVEIPDQFFYGDTVTITTSFFKKSTCYSFYKYQYSSIGNEQTITLVNIFIDQGDCKERVDIVKESFNFIVGQEDSYIFRFWKGRDDSQNNKFLTIEVPVVLE